MAPGCAWHVALLGVWGLGLGGRQGGAVPGFQGLQGPACHTPGRGWQILNSPLLTRKQRPSEAKGRAQVAREQGLPLEPPGQEARERRGAQVYKMQPSGQRRRSGRHGHAGLGGGRGARRNSCPLEKGQTTPASPAGPSGSPRGTPVSRAWAGQGAGFPTRLWKLKR